METGDGGEPTINTITKKSMVESLGNEIRIVQLGTPPPADGAQGPTTAMKVLEEWVIHNPIITGVDFDSLDYSTEELLNIKVSITYDWASLSAPEGGQAPTLFSFQPAETHGFGQFGE